jgi:hypothetical protein
MNSSVKEYTLCLVAIGIISFTLLIVNVNIVFGQVSGNLTSQPSAQEWIKIDTPTDGKQVPMDRDLLISGGSSDDSSKNCEVSVIVNNVKPYHSASATGSGGDNDFSQWNFTLSSNYTQIKEGPNRITAKLSCSPPITKWYSISVNGFRPSQSNENISLPTLTPSVLNPTNASTTENITTKEQPLQTQSQPISSINSTNTTESSQGNGKELNVVIKAAKNPVSRGDVQNITITVTDQSSSANIVGASITGKLLYPGGNYVKDFSGITDTNGQFVNSWTIGKHGDVGELTVEVQASAPGYESKSATGNFQISER